EFAFKQNAVSSVIAETDLDGFASQRILEQCGFKKYRQDETVWWRL
ncbi:MAG: N-acetyltransferase, partial [Oscillospiraceae bacterium]